MTYVQFLNLSTVEWMDTMENYSGICEISKMWNG